MDIMLAAILGVVLYLFSGLRVLREYERAVYFFLGRSWGAKGPGLIYLPPLFAKMQKVSLRVVAKDVDLPPEMKRAMARQAEAERERRAKIINAEGELQASEKLAQAARVIGREPAAIQLRYLQTVTEIASENKSTMIFPLPLDLFKGLLESGARRTETPALALPEKASGEVLPAPPAQDKVRR